MVSVVKRLLPGLLLIILAAAILLLSDLQSRRNSRQGRLPKVAIVKVSSNSLLDDVETGVLRGLAERGYDVRTLALTRFSAEGDLTTLNAIAKQVTSPDNDLVISISTLALQAVANANRDGKVKHVFAAVTDPVGAGVGVMRMNSLDKPFHMTGFGTFQPVENIFDEALKLYPGLKSVGAIWNPAESNSEACIKIARSVAANAGIELLEVPVHQSEEVAEAAKSLVVRGAQAFWSGCDSTVNDAIGALCGVAAQARVPVFSNATGQVKEGTLFDIGANYVDVGRAAAQEAADILDGASPAAIPVSNIMPERVMLNERVLQALRDPWRFDEDIRHRAELIVEKDGNIREKTSPARMTLDRKWRLQLIYYNDSPLAEDSIKGIEEGLRKAGLVKGLDYELQKRGAQGDIATMNNLFDAALQEGVDLFLVLSTPGLQIALRKAGQVPVVFTMVANALLTGAGVSDTEHVPTVTGVYTLGAYREMAEALIAYFPSIKSVGTLYSPAESNSAYNKDALEGELKAKGIVLHAVAVASSGELSDAATALCSRKLDAVVQIIDNQTSAGFAALARAAAAAKMPLLSFESSAVRQGAIFAIARDYESAGEEATSKAIQIMKGMSPAMIPFSPPRIATKVVNMNAAAASGFAIPAGFLQGAVDVNGSPIFAGDSVVKGGLK